MHNRARQPKQLQGKWKRKNLKLTGKQKWKRPPSLTLTVSYKDSYIPMVYIKYKKKGWKSLEKKKKKLANQELREKKKNKKLANQDNPGNEEIEVFNCPGRVIRAYLWNGGSLLIPISAGCFRLEGSLVTKWKSISKFFGSCGRLSYQSLLHY